MFKDKEEFKIVFSEHYNMLCNYAFSFLKNHNVSEDAVQDVFVHLWMKRNEINGVDLGPYLFTSVKNKCLEMIRKRKVEQQNLQSIHQDTSLHNTDIKDLEYEKYLRIERLNKSIRQLPDKCRDIFVLSKVNGLTYAEIAELKNITKKTVENHIANAIKMLRKSL